MASPGLLYVTMQPSPSLPLAQFDDWYNNEHGPARMRLAPLLRHGRRYAAVDGHKPAFLALYHLPDLPALLRSAGYAALRERRSPREAAVLAQVDVQRELHEQLLERRTDRDVEAGTPSMLVAVEVVPAASDPTGQHYRRWFEEEHIDLLSRLSSWQRTRLFRTSASGTSDPVKYLALHEFNATNGLGRAEHNAFIGTQWRQDIFARYVASNKRRAWSLFYTFGPAPRDLSSLSQVPASAAFVSPDGSTRTSTGPDAAIDSYILTPDAARIPYRLEGNPAPDAPTVAFCNSLLTSFRMWDPLVAQIKRERPDLRILRYDARGRHKIPHPPTPATLDLLTDDLSQLLDALLITRLRTLIGVSLGGVTAMNFALRNPTRLQDLIACDFNAASSDANTQAWKDRVCLAEKDDGKGITDLANQTVSRWFSPATLRGQPEAVSRMTEMVANNDVQGLKYSCTALWDYDLRLAMPRCTVASLLIVGEHDGNGSMVRAMQGFRATLGRTGAALKVVPEAGHLPMFENPVGFWEAIKDRF